MTEEETRVREAIDYCARLLTIIERGVDDMGEDRLSDAWRAASELMECTAEELYDSVKYLFQSKYV